MASDDRACAASSPRSTATSGEVVVDAARSIKPSPATSRSPAASSVEQSPTVVVVDRNRKAESLVGYVERNAINQAVADALRNSIERAHQGPATSAASTRTCANFDVRLRPLRPARRRAPQVKPASRRFGAPDGRLPRPSFASLKAPAKYRPSSARSTRAAPSGEDVAARACARGSFAKMDAAYTALLALGSGPGPQVRDRRRHEPASRTARAAAAAAAPPRLGGVDRERFAEHLSAPAGRGVPVPAAHDGAAGGAACGDLSGSRCASRATASPPRASRPRAAARSPPRPRPPSTLVEGEPLLDAARVGAHAISAELGGLSPGQVPRRRPGRRRAARRARPRRARAGARSRPTPGRTLVAMSGGVDSAVAALLAGEGAVAVTLELWADPDNDAEASCCSAHAVRVARSVAHGMGMPHFTLDLRERVPRRRRRPVPGRLRGRRDAEPVRGLQRPRAPRRDGRVRRPARRRARSPPATTRA